jgi:hypothetical protein
MKTIFVVSDTAKSPDLEPEAILSGYRVFASDDGHHFAGFNQVTERFRVSTSIVKWDPDTMIGITRSGRRYRLGGPPDDSGSAEAAWLAWSTNNGISEFTDVTGEYSRAARPRLN